jgi:hypothetical protein
VLSVDDFQSLASKEGLTIERRYCLAGHRRISWLTNVRAEVAVFLVRAS